MRTLHDLFMRNECTVVCGVLSLGIIHICKHGSSVVLSLKNFFVFCPGYMVCLVIFTVMMNVPHHLSLTAALSVHCNMN